MAPIIRTDGLTKDYGHVLGVDDLTFEVDQGTWHGPRRLLAVCTAGPVGENAPVLALPVVPATRHGPGDRPVASLVSPGGRPAGRPYGMIRA